MSAEDTILLRFFDYDDLNILGRIEDARRPVVKHVSVERQSGRNIDEQLLGEYCSERATHDHRIGTLLGSFEMLVCDVIGN